MSSTDFLFFCNAKYDICNDPSNKKMGESKRISVCDILKLTILFIFIKMFKIGQIGGPSWWRVCYQGGYPVLCGIHVHQISLRYEFKDTYLE